MPGVFFCIPTAGYTASNVSSTLPCDALQMPILQVKAKPNRHVASLTQQEDGTWLAQLKSPPVDSKANAELIALLAVQFGCSKPQVTIKSGANGRHKRVAIPD
jgi:uncharacterized protein (TIGR00251 family)